ncbi:uncharacterized protein ttc6 [Polypterus senegalus]|uniref:uncharacterized protein ttc6 n=1 Tax=Polypterus senegalus TaxID=55291 RepID=UPI001962C3F5|nr:uncharacterized protein ttc6 [Polypterus senegalus]XP_039597222.1 uncharacterized protein ttc6 [Polypterus senegalus]
MTSRSHQEDMDRCLSQLSEPNDNSEGASHRPAIAGILGTTRAAVICSRPKPPAKPRSGRGTEWSQRRAIKASDKVTSQIADGDPSATGDHGLDVRSDLQDLAAGGDRQRQKEAKQPSGLKRAAAVENGGHGVRSPQELLEEARGIAGVDTSSFSPQRVELEGRARTVDEIIASLRSGSHTNSVSASERMIKELLQRVLGHGYEQEDEEEQPERDAKVEELTLVPGSPDTVELLSAVKSERSELASQEAMNAGPSEGVPPRLFSSDVAQISMTSTGQLLEPHFQEDEDSPPEKRPLLSACLDEDLLTTEELARIMALPSQVSYSELIHVTGVPASTHVKSGRRPPESQVSFLGTWTPKIKSKEYKTIHHLCTASPPNLLPVPFQFASRIQHASNHKLAADGVLQQMAAESFLKTPVDLSRLLEDGVPATDVYGIGKEDGVRVLPQPSTSSLAEWQRIAEYYVERPRVLLTGQRVSLYLNESRMFWKPAPAKFAFMPSYIQEKMFPKYQALKCDVAEEWRHGDLPEADEAERDAWDAEARDARARCFLRKHGSEMELRSLDESRRDPKVRILKRVSSAPDLSGPADTILKVPADFKSLRKELALLKEQLTRPGAPMKNDSGSSVPILVKAPTANLTQPDTRGQAVRSGVEKKFSIVEKARVAGLKYIVHPKKKKRKRRRLSPEKMADVYRTLSQPPLAIDRWQSLPNMNRKPRSPLRVSRGINRSRCSSLPLALDFEAYTRNHGGIPEDTPAREWVRDIWNVWFDEVFPLPPEATRTEMPAEAPCARTEKLEEKTESAKEVMVPDHVDLSLALESSLTGEDLQAEVGRLTELMNREEAPNAFYFCRRGALHRKLGLLKEALEDLNTAIHAEPLLLDAYWHRHAVYLLKGRHAEALDDLNFITKHNKNHADAYKSKAEIYRNNGDAMLAVVNYTQAIKRNPADDENYVRRAEIYQKKDEILLAMEDYAKAFAVNPRRTDALMIHGLHHFKNSSWMTAIQDFSALINIEPQNSQARTYRGRAYASQGHYCQALEDLSAAVHLDPNNWTAFYYRGCILRTCDPDGALRDLSISVLINDNFENLGALLHRGILYAELEQWAQAICDFENVLRLDRSVAVAHVNLGLVYLLKMEHYYEAIRRFSDALKVEPTYTRAYICRAQAYHKVHDLQRALKDLSHAIHLQPDLQHLYLMRGQYLCEMKKFDLARFCIHYAAEMNNALGSSAVQQAAVQSFLQNHEKAIECLTSITLTHPTASVFVLLGKTQMKAKKYQDAVESFQTSLKTLSVNAKLLPAVPEAAEIFYLIGLCHKALAHLPEALEAFTNSVKMNPDLADAFYQRGLCRMRLQPAKSIQDFNQALAVNPVLFQAYLSRAIFYGLKGRYSKAILNCNEAICIQPASVRAYLYRGAFKFFMKTYRFAIDDLSTAIHLDGTCPLAYYNRGVCYQQTEEYDKALKDYGIVLLLGSSKEVDLKVLINRGLLYVALDDYENALHDFRAAALQSPEDANIFHAVGVCHHRIGALEEAVKAFCQALRRDRFFLDAYVGRGNVYMDFGHQEATKAARKDFLRALHLNPLCSKARINLGYNLQVCGKFQKAWQQFTIAADLEPTCSAAYEGRAIVNLQMGDTYAAFLDITTALKYDAARDQLLMNRGVINQFMGDIVGAMRDYQQAIQLNPRNALAHFNAANLYFHSRQFQQACEYYTKAVHLDPYNDCALLNRAITRSLLRDICGAMEDFQEALRLSPFSAPAYFNRANVYISLKKFKRAEQDLSQALVLQPDDALLYKLRADVRGHLGLTELAVLDYKQALWLEEEGEGPPHMGIASR